MFIRINQVRIKISSIQEYERKNQATSNKMWYLELKVSGKSRIFCFSTEQELDEVVKYLDSVLKVSEV